MKDADEKIYVMKAPLFSSFSALVTRSSVFEQGFLKPIGIETYMHVYARPASDRSWSGLP